MKNLKALTCLTIPLFALIVCATRARADEIGGNIYETRVIYHDSELVDNVACFVDGHPCIEFGASNITFKLNGFTITGQADPPANCAPGPSGEDGIDVVDQHHVAILGPGLVQKFRSAGIFLQSASNVRVRGVTASDNCFSGVFLFGTTHSDIEKNVSVRNAIGSQNFACGGT